MRVLTSSVLTFEWIVLALAIPVAINTAGVDAARAWLVFALATVLIVTALATMSRGPGVWFGWAVQGVAILAGLVVPMLAILGVIFTGLYVLAIHLGRTVEQAKAAQAAADATEHLPVSAPE